MTFKCFGLFLTVTEANATTFNRSATNRGHTSTNVVLSMMLMTANMMSLSKKLAM